MSSRELDDRMEEDQEEAVAAALGISVEELDSLDWEIEPLETSDGLHHANLVTFGDGSDAEVLSRVAGLTHGRWVQIGLL